MGDLVKHLRSGVSPYETITLAGVKHDPRCLEAADHIETLEVKNAQLCEALIPIDDAARDRASDAAEWRDSDTVAVWVTIGDLRRARAALKEQEKDDNI